MKVRTAVFASLALIYGVVVYAGNACTIGINGSDSMAAEGFAFFRYPQIIRHGTIVAFDPPDVLKEDWQGYPFIKRVVGMPGDTLMRHEHSVCVQKAGCFPAARDDAALLNLDVVPEDMFFVAGETLESLDSRYALIGLVHRDAIQAVGFELPKPLERFFGLTGEG